MRFAFMSMMFAACLPAFAGGLDDEPYLFLNIVPCSSGGTCMPGWPIEQAFQPAVAKAFAAKGQISIRRRG